VRREITVSIYERVKYGAKWLRKKVAIPPLKANGTLYLKNHRQGVFQLSWYEDRNKQWQVVKSRVGDRDLPFLSDAIAQAEDKSWFLSNQHRQVTDPTQNGIAQKKLAVEVAPYIAAKSGCRKTVSAHRQAVSEFQQWAARPKNGRGIIYVDEITKPLLRKFFDYLVDGDEDEDGPANCPFTAALKIMRVNCFVRSVLHLEPGKGPATKRDYKRELKSSRVPEIYSKQDMDRMFSVMDEEEHLIFSTFYESGLRKRELMHLETTDLICDELVPGRFKTEIRVQSKPAWKFQTKTGSGRTVWVSKELIDRLQERRATRRASKLLFGTSAGKPDHHLWDKLKAIARRAGLDPATVWLHKWRATAATNWLRSKELGGKGWDIGLVRQQLGHEDLQSIEHYIALVRTEELALQGPAQSSQVTTESQVPPRLQIVARNAGSGPARTRIQCAQLLPRP
jgi:integrase